MDIVIAVAVTAAVVAPLSAVAGGYLAYKVAAKVQAAALAAMQELKK